MDLDDRAKDLNVRMTDGHSASEQLVAGGVACTQPGSQDDGRRQHQHEGDRLQHRDTCSIGFGPYGVRTFGKRLTYDRLTREPSATQSRIVALDSQDATPSICRLFAHVKDDSHLLYVDEAVAFPHEHYAVDVWRLVASGAGAPAYGARAIRAMGFFETWAGLSAS